MEGICEENPASLGAAPMANACMSGHEEENERPRGLLEEMRAANVHVEKSCRHLEDQGAIMHTQLESSNLKLRQMSDTIAGHEEEIKLTQSEGHDRIKDQLAVAHTQIKQPEKRNESPAKLGGKAHARLAQLTRLPTLTPLANMFPMHFESGSLHAEWNHTNQRLRQIMEPEDEKAFSDSLFDRQNIPAPLRRELSALLGLPCEHPEPQSLSAYFKSTINLPSDHNIVRACLQSRAYRWCFDTNFHTSGLESQELHQLWTAISNDGTYVYLEKTMLLTIGRWARAGAASKFSYNNANCEEQAFSRHGAAGDSKASDEALCTGI